MAVQVGGVAEGCGIAVLQGVVMLAAYLKLLAVTVILTAAVWAIQLAECVGRIQGEVGSGHY